MDQWFECKIKFDREVESGEIKSVTEPYIVEALSFTEAEARIIKETTPYLTAGGELTVTAVNKKKYANIVTNETGDKWYRTKTNYITLDEKKGVEKRIAEFNLIQASDLEEGLKNLVEFMKDSLGDYEISMIQETTILDVFRYNLAGDENA